MGSKWFQKMDSFISDNHKVARQRRCMWPTRRHANNSLLPLRLLSSILQLEFDGDFGTVLRHSLTFLRQMNGFGAGRLAHCWRPSLDHHILLLKVVGIVIFDQSWKDRHDEDVKRILIDLIPPRTWSISVFRSLPIRQGRKSVKDKLGLLLST